MIQHGEDLVVNVRTGTDPDGDPIWTPVADIDSVKAGGSRNIAKKAVFMKQGQHKRPGPRDLTCSIAGSNNPTDPGQLALHQADAAGTTVEVQVLPDGTNGWEAEAYVSSLDFDASPEEFQSIGWELEIDGVTTAVGTGPAL
jgi:hypothetical protein